jgi:aryl-alcohol dehydrogenase-like predicted oxidoreductase
MEQRNFGSTQRQVAVIGQGTWYDENEDPASVISALRLGLDRGMKHIDTAEMYGSGAAEKLVGQAIVGRRDEVFLVSKVLPQNAGRRRTIKACENSLLRLKTNRLDCYLLHWRGRHPLEETLPPSSSCVRQEKYFPGESAISMSTIWKKSGASPAACSPVTRCCITSRSGPLNMLSFPGASNTKWLWWDTVHSVMEHFRRETRRAGEYCTK